MRPVVEDDLLYLLFSPAGDSVQVPVYPPHTRLALPLQPHAALPLLLPLPLRGSLTYCIYTV